MNKGGSAMFRREAPESFARKLAKYDIISFDVFDTLIFRPFSKPADLFFAVGKVLNYNGFREMRIRMEEKARKKKYKGCGSREVNLNEIWRLMEYELGIEAELGMKTEWHCELRYCFANPYMLQVVNELQQLNKKLIVISDMYLQQNQIQKLLTSCGYDRLFNYFVSADYGVAKYDGGLFDKATNIIDNNSSFVHVGDNKSSDYTSALKCGWMAYLYHNINEIGINHRAVRMSKVIGSVYRGLVNAYLHNGTGVYSTEYKNGFVCYGLFLLGYCEWLNNYADKNNIKLTACFMNSEIINKVYRRLYNTEFLPAEVLMTGMELASICINDNGAGLIYGSNIVSYMIPRRLTRRKWQEHNILGRFRNRDTQKGILDFVDYYLERMHTIPRIRGRDAYIPIELALDEGGKGTCR